MHFKSTTDFITDCERLSHHKKLYYGIFYHGFETPLTIQTTADYQTHSPAIAAGRAHTGLKGAT